MKTVNESSSRIRQWMLIGMALIAGLDWDRVFAETVEPPKVVYGGQAANVQNADSAVVDQNGRIFFKASGTDNKGSKKVNKKKRDGTAAAESYDENIGQPVKVTIIGDPVCCLQADFGCK